MTYEKKTRELLKNRIRDQKFVESVEREISQLEDRIVILKQRSHILGLEKMSKMERHEWAYHYELRYRVKCVEARLALVEQGLSVLPEEERGLLLEFVDHGSNGLLSYAEEVLGINRSAAYRRVSKALKEATLSIYGLLGSCDWQSESSFLESLRHP